MHRRLVDAAVGGATIQQLLDVAGDYAGRQVVLDQDGDLQSSGSSPASIDPHSLRRAQTRSALSDSDHVTVEGHPTALSVPVVAGASRRGIALMFDVSDRAIDEQEIVLSALASAVAIYLARHPKPAVPTLDEAVLGSERDLDTPHAEWAALALVDTSVGLQRLASVVRAELNARNIDGLVFRETESLVVLAHRGAITSWDIVFNSLRLRLGSSTLRAGAGRARSTLSGARESVREALEAARRGGEGLTHFQAIELSSLLDGLAGGREFVDARLGPILTRRDLLETLAVYLRTGRRGTEAAERLQVHRNTVLYRLGRIRELLGVDVEDGTVAFELEFALRLRDLHHAGTTEGADTG